MSTPATEPYRLSIPGLVGIVSDPNGVIVHLDGLPTNTVYRAISIRFKFLLTGWNADNPKGVHRLLLLRAHNRRGSEWIPALVDLRGHGRHIVESPWYGTDQKGRSELDVGETYFVTVGIAEGNVDAYLEDDDDNTRVGEFISTKETIDTGPHSWQLEFGGPKLPRNPGHVDPPGWEISDLEIEFLPPGAVEPEEPPDEEPSDCEERLDAAREELAQARRDLADTENELLEAQSRIAMLEASGQPADTETRPPAAAEWATYYSARDGGSAPLGVRLIRLRTGALTAEREDQAGIWVPTQTQGVKWTIQGFVADGPIEDEQAHQHLKSDLWRVVDAFAPLRRVIWRCAVTAYRKVKQ